MKRAIVNGHFWFAGGISSRSTYNVCDRDDNWLFSKVQTVYSIFRSQLLRLSHFRFTNYDAILRNALDLNYFYHNNPIAARRLHVSQNLAVLALASCTVGVSLQHPRWGGGLPYESDGDARRLA